MDAPSVCSVAGSEAVIRGCGVQDDFVGGCIVPMPSLRLLVPAGAGVAGGQCLLILDLLSL